LERAYSDGFEIGVRAAINVVGEVSYFAATGCPPASAIEARRAETQSGSVEDESAVGNAETPGKGRQ
jgi:hypothetical protein